MAEALASFRRRLPETVSFLTGGTCNETARAIFSDDSASGALLRVLTTFSSAAAAEGNTTRQPDLVLLEVLRLTDQLERSRTTGNASNNNNINTNTNTNTNTNKNKERDISMSLLEKQGALDNKSLGVAGMNGSCLSPPPRDCSWYKDCLEAAHQCGVSGFALGWGDHYCHRFDYKLGWLGGNVEEWLWATMHCLQVALVPFLALPKTPLTCGVITLKGFSSQSSCLTDNGAISICDLSLVDMLRILGVPEPPDLLAFQGLQAIIGALQGCVQNLLPFR